MLTSDLPTDSFRRYLFLGRSGSGKSTAAAQWRGDCKKYLFSLDGRVANLRHYPNIEFDSYKSTDGFSAIDRKIESLQKSCPFEVVMFSGISGLLDCLIHEAITTLKLKNRRLHQIGNVVIPDLEHHLYVSTAVNHILYKGLFTLPCDVILEGHIVNAYDSQGNITGNKLLSTDKLAEKIPSYFDEVWEFYKTSMIKAQPPDFFVNFSSSVARTSRTNLPQRMNITKSSLWEKIKEQK